MAQMKQAKWSTHAQRGEHINLGGSAHIFSAEGLPVGHYLVQDLTSRGARLKGERCRCDAWKRVHVMLALPSQPEPIAVWGDIHELDRDSAGVIDMELRFTDLSADDEDQIEDAILTEWSRLHHA